MRLPGAGSNPSAPKRGGRVPARGALYSASAAHEASLRVSAAGPARRPRTGRVGVVESRSHRRLGRHCLDSRLSVGRGDRRPRPLARLSSVAPLSMVLPITPVAGAPARRDQLEYASAYTVLPTARRSGAIAMRPAPAMLLLNPLYC